MTENNQDMTAVSEQETEAENPAGTEREESAAGEPGKTELELLQGDYDVLNDKYLRLMAEYDNFRKRTLKERDDIYPSATAAAVGKFLPVLDNFERAAAFEHPDDDFGKGFDMIYQNLKDILASLKVEAIGEAGEEFDPAVHNAVMHIEDESLGKNVVAQVLQKGYKIGDKVIRYAMVQTAN